MLCNQHGPIGIFDSGFGGLTVLKEIVQTLPQYNYLYLGDNARAPYGTRSFETVYHYTLQCVKWFFKQGCPLVILACNTASAKALRSIQQNDLKVMAPQNRVLGVIRPTTETIGKYTQTGKVGVLGTPGTVQSKSYPIEIGKFYPGVEVYQEACPIWVPLIENDEYDSEGAAYFIKQNLQNLLAQAKDIDVILLACTHYPLIQDQILQFLPENIKIVSQAAIVANRLQDYLNRHAGLEQRCERGGKIYFYTTDNTVEFDRKGSKFFGAPVVSKQVIL